MRTEYLLRLSGTVGAVLAHQQGQSVGHNFASIDNYAHAIWINDRKDTNEADLKENNYLFTCGQA